MNEFSNSGYADDDSASEEDEAAIVSIGHAEEVEDGIEPNHATVSRSYEMSENQSSVSAYSEVSRIQDEAITLEHEGFTVIGHRMSDISDHERIEPEMSGGATTDTFLTDFKLSTLKKPPKNEEAGEESGDDSQTCSICFEPWTNTNAHRLASLKCGHLFGKSCITKWLKGHPGKCPQCNARAHRKDIRVIFARSVKTVDTSEHDHVVQELEREKEARKKAELEAAKTRLTYQVALAECNQLKQEIERYQQQIENLRQIQDPMSSQQTSVMHASTKSAFVLEKHLKVWEGGGCRVMAYSEALNSLCVSQPSSVPLFPGFGIKKINSLDFKSSQYVALHSKAIRDLSFNLKSPDSYLLSCSMDKTIKLTSMISNKVIHMFECATPVWSCTWNTDDRNYFYAGLQNGTVNVFDIRNLSRSIVHLNVEGSCSPVISLQYLSKKPGPKVRVGGLLVGKLDRSEFYEKQSTEEYRLHLLPVEANLVSLSLEETTGHIMATYRPTPRNPHIRHQVSELVVENVTASDDFPTTVCKCNTIHTFHGGSTQKLLTRNRLLLHPENERDLIACTADEASQSFHIWHATSGQQLQKVTSCDPVLDICPVAINEESFLVALTDKQISIYKYHSTLR